MRVDHVFEDYTGIDVNDKGMLKDTQFPLPRNFVCLKAMMDAYEANCSKMEDYDLKYVKYFVKDCESLPTNSAIELLVDKLRRSCDH